MDEPYSTKRLLVLRKLTRTMAGTLRGQLQEHLATLAPLLRPQSVLGGYADGNPRETIPGAERAFKELQTIYGTIAGSKPFSLSRDVKSPIEISSSVLELTPHEYVHSARTERESKTVTITAPFQWVISYAGYSPRRFKELLADRNRSNETVQEFLLHYVALHVVLTRQAGLGKLFQALHFPLTSARLPEFGELPIYSLSPALGTVRPPDAVIVESTEISGSNTFEEIVNLDDVAGLRDPFKEQLAELVKSYAEELQSASSAGNASAS
jgi:hypothetical protein